MPNPIRIILVDDHEMIRDSWKMLLDKDDRFSIIAQCKNGMEAVEQTNALHPDIVLMDINMSPVDGFEATKLINRFVPSAKVIGVSANNNHRYAAKMLAQGAKGFVTKNSVFKELKEAIMQVQTGKIYICDELRNKMPE
jgi:two-component system invasion response regulator UvrY